MLSVNQAAKSAIVNTTALSNAISPPISSVVFVAMQDIWLETVPTDNVEPIGGMVHQQEPRPAVLLPDVLVEEMLSTASTRYDILLPSRMTAINDSILATYERTFWWRSQW